MSSKTIDGSSNQNAVDLSINGNGGVVNILNVSNGGTSVATTGANNVFAGPNGIAGPPSFRTLVTADLPPITPTFSGLTTNNLAFASSSTAITTISSAGTTGNVLNGVTGNQPSFGKVDLTTTVTGVLPNANTTGSTNATPNTLVLRDANANSRSNNIILNSTSITSSGINHVLTVASPESITILGSSSDTFQLPDATTLYVNSQFTFNNNGSVIQTINNNGGSQVGTVAGAYFIRIILIDNSTANGTWDVHNLLPSTLAANQVVIGPPSGVTPAAPSARNLVLKDLPPGSTSGIPLLAQGTLTAPAYTALSLSGSGVTGTLPVSSGGTNTTSLTAAGGSVYASSTTAMASTAAGTSGQPLLSGGAGAPSFADLAVAHGGTGQTGALVAGAAVYASSTSAMASTAVGSAGQYLQSQGAGTPIWAVPSGTISGLTTGKIPVATGGTTIGNSTMTESGGNISISGDFTASHLTPTNALGTSYGGTGQTSALVAGAVVYGSTTSVMAVTAAGTTGQYLQSNAAGAPTWSTPTGTISGLTTNYFPKATSATTIGNSALFNTTQQQLIWAPSGPTNAAAGILQVAPTGTGGAYYYASNATQTNALYFGIDGTFFEGYAPGQVLLLASGATDIYMYVGASQVARFNTSGIYTLGSSYPFAYSEASWTPTLTFGTGGPAIYFYIGQQKGYYVKIGKQVTITFYVEFYYTSIGGGGTGLYMNIPVTLRTDGKITGTLGDDSKLAYSTLIVQPKVYYVTEYGTALVQGFYSGAPDIIQGNKIMSSVDGTSITHQVFSGTLTYIANA